MQTSYTADGPIVRANGAHLAHVRGPLASATADALLIANALTAFDDSEPYCSAYAFAACCIWEAMLDHKAQKDGHEKTGLLRYWHDNGTNDMREMAVSWAPFAEIEYRAAAAMGYEDGFDWEFIPLWLSFNGAWTDPAGMLQRERVPAWRYLETMTHPPAPPATDEAPADDGSAAVQTMLEARGYVRELQGGGCHYMVLKRGGAAVIVSYEDGADMPSRDKWQVTLATETEDDGMNPRASVSTLDGEVSDLLRVVLDYEQQMVTWVSYPAASPAPAGKGA